MTLVQCTIHVPHTTNSLVPLPLRTTLLAFVFFPKRSSISQPSHLPNLEVRSTTTKPSCNGSPSGAHVGLDLQCLVLRSNSPPMLARCWSSTVNPLLEEPDREDEESCDQTGQPITSTLAVPLTNARCRKPARPPRATKHPTLWVLFSVQRVEGQHNMRAPVHSFRLAG